MKFDVASLLVWRNMLCWGHNAVKMWRGNFFFFCFFSSKKPPAGQKLTGWCPLNSAWREGKWNRNYSELQGYWRPRERWPGKVCGGDAKWEDTLTFYLSFLKKKKRLFRIIGMSTSSTFYEWWLLFLSKVECSCQVSFRWNILKLNSNPVLFCNSLFKFLIFFNGFVFLRFHTGGLHDAHRGWRLLQKCSPGTAEGLLWTAAQR